MSISRRINVRVIAVLALAIAVIAAFCVGLANTSGRAAAQAAQGYPGPYGTGGKISLRPAVNWERNGGPADTRSVLGPLSKLLPFAVPVFGADINVSASAANEVSISSDPTRPLYFIGGANNSAGSGHYTTTDGGVTWTRGSFSGIGDPVTAYDNLGNAYFAQLSTGTCPDPAVVRRSSDGGLTWGNQVTAVSDSDPNNHFIDKPWMTADQYPASPFYGRIYVTASSFYAPNCNLGAYINNREVLAYSTDHGATFSQPVTINDASHNQDQFTNPVVAPNGTVYVSFQYQNCTYDCTSSIPMLNLLTKSTDGGITWSPTYTITGQVITPTGAFSGGYQYLYASSTSTGFRHNDQSILGVNPSNSNTVYSLWTDGRWDTSFVYQGVTGKHADIAFSRSTDGGGTWSAPVRVNDDTQGNGADQFFPWMTVGTDGTIHASWMDRRDAGSGYQYREYYSQSTDGGITWSPNQPVSDVGGTPGSFIGDYSSIAVNSDNTLVLPFWTDSRSGTQAYTDRGVLGPQLTPTATGTSVGTATPTSTSVGGTPTATPTCSSNPTAWATETPMNTARELAGGAVVNNQFYVVSGFAGGTYSSALERYDPVARTWTSLAPVPTPVSQARSAGLGTRIYLAGGFNVSGGGQITAMQIYDTQTDTWSQGAPLPDARSGAGVAAFNGKIYVIAGFGPNFATENTVFEYDPVANTYTTKAPVPAAEGNVAVGVVGNRIYVVGGSATFMHYAYDPATDTWTTIASGLTSNFQSPGTFALNGELWVEGGTNGFSPYPPDEQVQIYNPGTDSWRFGPTFNTPRYDSSAAGTINDTGYVAGGVDYNTDEIIASVESVTGGPCGTPTGTATTVPTNSPTSTATRTFTATAVATNTAVVTDTSTPVSGTETSTPQASSTTTVIPTQTNTPQPGSPTVTSTPCTISFTDVHPTDYFYNDVKCVYCLGAVSGYSDGTFRPFANTTRGQMTKIIVLALRIPLYTPTAGATFNDVPRGSTFFDYVETAAHNQIVSGYSDGSFRPNALVTRGQLSKIDAIAANKILGWDLLNPTTPTFSDVPPTNPFYTYIETVSCHGVVSGYSDGTFRWTANAIRAQIAKIVCVTSQDPPAQCLSGTPQVTVTPHQ